MAWATGLGLGAKSVSSASLPSGMIIIPTPNGGALIIVDDIPGHEKMKHAGIKPLPSSFVNPKSAPGIARFGNVLPTAFYEGIAHLHTELFHLAGRSYEFVGYQHVCSTGHVPQPFPWYVCASGYESVNIFGGCHAAYVANGAGDCAFTGVIDHVNGDHIVHNYHSKNVWNDGRGIQCTEAWAKIGGAPEYALRLPRGPIPLPRPSFNPRPNWLPNINPDAMPVWGPAAMPTPLPYAALPNAKPDPWLSDKVMPHAGPRARPFGRPRPFYRPVPGIAVIPRPGSQPDIAFDFPPVAGPRPVVRPVTNVPGRPTVRPHRNTPPRKKEHEGKVSGKGAPAALGIMRGAANIATEAMDALDAAWDAAGQAGGWLTKEPGVQTLPQQKAADILNAMKDPDFDWGGFFAAFAANLAVANAMDAVAAQPGKALAGASKHTPPHNGLPIGYGVGPAL